MPIAARNFLPDARLRREIRIFLLNIQVSDRVFPRPATRSTFYAKRLCDVRFKDTQPELSGKELSASREDCYELTKELRRDIRFARIPTGLFSYRAQFSAFTLWLSFYAVFLYEKRSAVSFPPDVAPSKDTGEYWTLLHEIYSYTYIRMFSEYIRTFFEQLSIFDCDPLKALVVVRDHSKERKITRIVKRPIRTSFPLFFSQFGGLRCG